MIRLGRNKREVLNGKIVVTDREVQSKLAFIGLTERDLGVITSWRDACEAALDSLVDEFYKHIANTPTTRAIISNHTTVERQRPMITRYIQTMLTGRIDDQYVEYRRHVGATHDRVDLDSNWYVAMYEVIRRVLTDAVRKAGASGSELIEFMVSLSRLIQADIGLTVTALTDARRSRIETLNRQIREQMDDAKTFLDAMRLVLDSLTTGNLTTRLDGSYREEYTAIQEALNATTQSLDVAISQVATASSQVAAASQQISAGSQSLAQGTSEQASTLEEISSSLQEMASMSNKNLASAKEARSLTEGARAGADAGVDRMQRLSEAINRIKTSADSTARIVKTIDEIAFQTNLLALNAAVEAARAGDAGKGFAVVAEEVRNLAMRSAEAAKNTAALIEESVKNAEGGVNLNKEVLCSLHEINSQVRKVSEVMAEITAASDQQVQGVAQIATAIDQINEVTQTTAANAEESASTAEELSSQAAEMQSLVSNFHLSHTQERAALKRPAVRGVAKQKSAAAPSRTATSRNKVREERVSATEYADPTQLIPFSDSQDQQVLSDF